MVTMFKQDCDISKECGGVMIWAGKLGSKMEGPL